MENLNIQWVTQDPELFELDWIEEILQTQDIKVITNAEDGLADKNSLVICNHAVNYRIILDKLRQNGKKYGVFLLSDENLIEPCEWLHDPACLFSLRNYINPWIFGHPKVATIGLGFKRNFNKDQVKEYSVEEKENLWCFAGTPHGERERMVEIFGELKPNKTHYCSGFNAEDGLETHEYRELLNSSVFALCPPGQDSMDSFRLYEALETGCIPVALKRTERMPIHPSYWHAIFEGDPELPFVLGETWEECESNVQQIINEEKLAATQRNCKNFWIKWKNIWKERAQKSLITLSSV